MDGNGCTILGMSKQMSITISDEIYERLRVSSEESMRPIATEAVYRIKVGLGEGFNRGDGIKDRVKVKDGVPTEKEDKLDKLVRSGVIKKGVKELPSQDIGGFKTYFKK